MLSAEDTQFANRVLDAESSGQGIEALEAAEGETLSSLVRGCWWLANRHKDLPMALRLEQADTRLEAAS